MKLRDKHVSKDNGESLSIKVKVYENEKSKNSKIFNTFKLSVCKMKHIIKLVCFE